MRSATRNLAGAGVVLASLSWAAPAGADDYPACREHSKLNTADADPLGEGVLQIQVNCAFDRSTRRWDAAWERERRDPARAGTVGVAAAYGTSDTLDLGVGWGYSRLSEEEAAPSEGGGPTDLSVSMKWRCLEGTGWGIAFVPALTIPSGQEETPERLGSGRGFWGLDVRMAAVLDLSNDWSLNLDAGFEAAFGGRGDFQGSLGANLAVGYQLARRFQPELELNGAHDFIGNAGNPSRIALTAGFASPLSDRLCVRGGFQRGIAGRNAEETATITVSVDLRF